MNRSSILVWILLLLTAESLYFQLQEGKEKCFYEDVVQQQPIINHYEFLDTLSEQKYDPTVGIVLKIKDDNDQTVYKELLLKQEGKVVFYNKNSRYLKFCYQTNTMHWLTQNEIIRFKIRIIQQDQQDMIDSMNNSTKLDDLKQLIRYHEQLNVQGGFYLKKVNQEQLMNDRLIQQNEDIIEKINLWTMLQILTLIGSACIQTLSLGKFFRQNNII